jgi:hypothetical protein
MKPNTDTPKKPKPTDNTTLEDVKRLYQDHLQRRANHEIGMILLTLTTLDDDQWANSLRVYIPQSISKRVASDLTNRGFTVQCGNPIPNDDGEDKIQLDISGWVE